MKKTVFAGVIIFTIFILSGCVGVPDPSVESNQDNNTNEQNFVEEIIQPAMTELQEVEVVSQAVATPEPLANP